MIKTFFRFLIITVALFVGAINYSSSFQQPFLNILHAMQSYYLNSIEFIDSTIQEHFNQAKNIALLQEKLKSYDENHLLMLQVSTELQTLYKANNAHFYNQPNIEVVRAISYAKLGNFNRVWLNVKDYNSTKIYGLVYKNNVAGIVISQNKKPLALLNKDIKSSYAVYIGKEKAPGIAHGNNGENIIVKFIPTWFKITKDDEVITSGLDNIFFHGLSVGKVLSVTSAQGYQNAIVKPYFIATELNYFYMIKSPR